MSISAYKFTPVDSKYSTFYFDPNNCSDGSKAINNNSYLSMNGKMIGVAYYASFLSFGATRPDGWQDGVLIQDDVYATTFGGSRPAHASLADFGYVMYSIKTNHYYKSHDITRETVYLRDFYAADNGSVDKTRTYYSFSSVTCKPTGSAGYEFFEWRYNSASGAKITAKTGVSINATTNAITVSGSLVADIVAYAVFRKSVSTLSVTKSSSNGAIALSVDGSALYIASAFSDSYSDHLSHTIRVVAYPNDAYTFGAWSGTGVLGSSVADYTFTMQDTDVSVVASFTEKPTFACTCTKTNPTFGTVTVTQGDNTYSESANVVSFTGHTTLEYTATAVVTNTSLNLFSGWYSGGTLVSSQLTYSFTKTDTTAVSIEARFAAIASYDMIKRVSDGSTSYNAGNAAYDAGCRISSVSRTPVYTSPNDKYFSGSITLTATAATGWRIASWNVIDNDGTGHGFTVADGTATLTMTFNLYFNCTVTANFTKLIYTVTAGVHASAAGRGASVDISGGLTGSGTTATFAHGSPGILTATVPSGYTFGGWYNADTWDLLSYSSPYSLTITSPLNVFIFLCSSLTVVVSNASGVTGTSVGINSLETSSTSKEVSGIIIGTSATIKAIPGTDGAVFDAWYLTSDLTKPLGYSAVQNIQFTDPLSLTAKFIATPPETVYEYIAVLNEDDETHTVDGALGIVVATGESVTEITENDWSAGCGGPVSTGITINNVQPANRYYKVVKGTTITISVSPATTKAFTGWTKSYIDATPAETTKVYAGNIATIDVYADRNYVLRAKFGSPSKVPVSVQYAEGCDSSYGLFIMSPVSADRSVIQSGVSDKYLQGDSVTVTANVVNGFKFVGWYSDLQATLLVSSDTTYTFSVIAPSAFFAKYAADNNFIYKWAGGSTFKMAEWRSKRFVATKPFNPSAARVYAGTYPVYSLNLFMCSSPDSPSTVNPSVSVYPRNQNGFRLPMARPDKYLEIEVKTSSEITEAVVSTSMEGLSQ